MKYKLGTLMILFLLCITIAAQRKPSEQKQSTSSDKIRTSSGDHGSSVETIPMRVKSLTRDGKEVSALKLYMQVTAEFSHSIGKKKPETIVLYFRNLSDPYFMFDARSDRLLWFTADEKRILLGHMKREDMLGVGGASEWLSSTVLFDDFENIAKAKRLVGHLGNFTFEVSSAQQNAFIEFIKAVVKE